MSPPGAAGHAPAGARRADPAVRFQRQAGSYRFPYHWLAQRTDGGFGATRTMSWALEYLAVLDACARMTAEVAPRRVLDVGCGDGRFAAVLLDGCDVSVTGIDPVPQAIAFARAFHHDDERATFSAARVQDLDDGGFDVATLVEVLEHVPEAEIGPLIDGVWRRVVPGGRLVLSVPTVARPVHAKHERHYTAALLAEHLTPWFRLERAEGVHGVGRRSRLLERAVANRVAATTHDRVLGLIRRAYDRWSARAPVGRAAHLVAVAHRIDRP